MFGKAIRVLSVIPKETGERIMRILVYGAGVLGSNLAHVFCSRKKDVTLLARGRRAEEIRQKGLVIKHCLKFRTTKDQIKVIETLDQEDFYDVVFVVMQYVQIAAVLPILKANVSRTIVFIGNNLSPKEIEAQLPDKTVLFGFLTVAGKRENGKVVSASLGRKITLGSASGGKFYRSVIEAAFADTKYKIKYCDKMDDWLKTHAAAILVVAFACYYTDGDLKKIKRDKPFLNRMIDANKEVYDVLKKLEYEILPDGEYDYVTTKRRADYLFLKILTGTFLGKLAASEHAMNAVPEIRALSRAFDRLIEKSGVPTPEYDKFRAYLPAENGNEE